MKKNALRRFPLLSLTLVLVMGMAGCNQSDDAEIENTPSPTPVESSASPNTNVSSGSADSIASPNTNVSSGSADSSANSSDLNATTELYVRFGDEGAPFTMHLYDNDTAATIARHVGSADWRIPIYHYNDYVGWEVMQYYDIPSRYDIPSNPVSVTTEQAGTVYYSEPNRIVLFFGDAEVSGEYTQVGYFDATEEFLSAVESNPVLEGWSNKIIHISANE